MNPQSMGKLVRDRRRALGLAPRLFAKMAQISHYGLNEIEEGRRAEQKLQLEIGRIFVLLGLSSFPTAAAVSRKRGLRILVDQINSNCGSQITLDGLQRIVSTGTAPLRLRGEIRYMLDEVPLEYLIMAAEEVAFFESLKPSKVWVNISVLAVKHSVRRHALWS